MRVLADRGLDTGEYAAAAGRIPEMPDPVCQFVLGINLAGFDPGYVRLGRSQEFGQSPLGETGPRAQGPEFKGPVDSPLQTDGSVFSSCAPESDDFFVRN